MVRAEPFTESSCNALCKSIVCLHKLHHFELNNWCFFKESKDACLQQLFDVFVRMKRQGMMVIIPSEGWLWRSETSVSKFTIPCALLKSLNIRKNK